MNRSLKKNSVSTLALVVLFLSALLNTYASAEEIRFESGDKAVNLIELYTSEGCYSCPPADRWLSGLLKNEGLFREFVPVSFHVDYWNYLGWRDTYSKAQFSERQRQYQQLGQVSGVYTPGMFIDGYEWRSWRSSESARFSKPRKRSSQSIGNLQLTHNNETTTIVFQPNNKKTTPSFAYIALLGVGISAPIPAGENKGKTLHHDFVVLGFQRAPLVKQTDGTFSAAFASTDTIIDAPRYALGAWVTNERDNKPLQATGGWID